MLRFWVLLVVFLGIWTEVAAQEQPYVLNERVGARIKVEAFTGTF